MNDVKRALKLATKPSVLTYRVTGWIARNDEVRAETERGQELLASLVGVVSNDRSGHFHPSASGSCPRRQIFEYLGFPPEQNPPASLRAIFHDGHFRHLKWQLMLLNAGLLTDVEVDVGDAHLKLGGSIDGINADEKWLFELKGTRYLRSVRENGVMPQHLRQVHAYFLLSDYHKAVVVYEDKASQQFEEFLVVRDNQLLSEVEAEFRELAEHIDDGTLPEMLEDCKQQKGDTYERCPYSGACFGAASQQEAFVRVAGSERAPG